MTPAQPISVVLYVRNPAASATFYQKLLARDPIASSANYSMFALESGMLLGLWAQGDVQPPPAGAAGAVELATSLPDEAAVDACHRQWVAGGVQIIQSPVQMDFGYTFTAQDPDGHRLRVMALNRP